MKRIWNNCRLLFVSSRPISWVNTAFPFAAGYILTARTFDITLVIGTLYFLIPYNLMMYGVNDVFDYESDRKNPRKGGVEGAVLSKSRHKLTLWAVAITNIPFILFLLLKGDFAANIVLALVIFQVLAYSLPKLRFKERPFVDSFTSACHFVGPLLYALVLVGWNWSYVGFVIAFMLWGIASHAFGAVQDMKADRQAKIGSVATVIGARNTVHFSALCYGTASLILFFQGVPGAICGITNFLYIGNVLPFWNISEKNPEVAHQGWKRFLWINQIAGFVITLLIIYNFQ